VLDEGHNAWQECCAWLAISLPSVRQADVQLSQSQHSSADLKGGGPFDIRFCCCQQACHSLGAADSSGIAEVLRIQRGQQPGQQILRRRAAVIHCGGVPVSGQALNSSDRFVELAAQAT